MDASQRRLYERALRVVAFMEAALADFPPNSRAGALLINIKDALAAIANLDAMRTTGASKREQGTAGRARTRTKLRRMLQRTVETAEAIALDHPEVEGIFSLAGKDGSDLTLIATARTFVENAEPLAARFTEYDLPPTFFSEMFVLANKLYDSMTLQTEGTEARRGSREALEEILQRLNGLIERLDAVVSNKYRDAPDRLAAWDAARRVENAPRSRNSGNNTPAPPEENS